MKNEYSFKDGSLVYIFAVASMFVASVVLSMILGVVVGVTGQEMSTVASQNWAIYLNSILSELAFFLVYFIYTKQNKIKKYSLKNVNKSIFDLRFLVVFASSLVVFFGSLNFTTFFNTLFLSFATPSISGVPLNNFGEFLLSVLCFAIIPAIAEELIFRGVVFSSLKNKIGLVWAVIVSSVAFTLIHFSIFQTIHQFLLGVVLSLIFYFTGKLVYSMFFHFFNNFFVLFFVYVSGNQNFGIFSQFGALEIVLTFVIFFVCVGLAVLLFYLMKVLTKNKQKEGVQSKEVFETSNIDKQKLKEENKISSQYEDVLPIALYIATVFICVLFWAVNSFKGGL